MKFNLSPFIKLSFTQLKRNKTRSFLTMLGIIIGVTSVILLVSIGAGLQHYIKSQFESLGSNLIYITPGQTGEGGQNFAQGFSSGAIRFEFEDIKDLQTIKEIDTIVPLVQANDVITYGKEEIFSEVNGLTVDAEKAMNINLVEGRFFNSAEEDRGAKVAVVGYQIKKDLFSDYSPIGETISIGEDRFQVIGLVEEMGQGAAGLGQNIDNVAYIPYTTAFEITGQDDFLTLVAVASSDEVIEKAKEEIEAVLSKKYDDDFSVFDQTQILSIIGNILGTLTLGLAGIAAISLVVGGVGIMNIMFVSVTERIKEIGLRKAVGATYKDILFQFLCESTVLSLFGGLIGVIIGFAVSMLINNFFPSQVTLWSVALSFGVSSLIGIIFGVAPARKAAMLSPIEALRYE
jgi:putative ABC transport system permease protein